MRRFKSKTGTTFNINLELDKNERFVLRRCIGYLTRHLRLKLVFDRETLVFTCWVLGFDMQRLGDHLVGYADRVQRIETSNRLAEDVNEVDQYAAGILDLMQELKVDHFGRFRRFVVDLLRKRKEQLAHAGQSNLENNIANIKKTFNLDDRETALCTFLFIMTAFDEPEMFFDTHLHCDRYAGRKYLTNILDMSDRELNRVISGNLSQVGILDVDSYNMSIERDFLSFFQNPADRSFAKDLYTPVRNGEVPLRDFLISPASLDHMQSLLKARPQTATHLLFYGPPGTGKTSLARALAHAAGVSAFEILQGKQNTAEQRRVALIAAINMTAAAGGGIVLVDEADNLLNTRFSWLMRGETQDKGWLNRILEKPGVVVIWITNAIDGIEDSVLRRFAFSLHFKPFNRQQRIMLWERIVRRKKVKRFFSAQKIAFYAGNYQTSAGAIDTALQKAIEIKPDSARQFHRALGLNLDAFVALQNRGETPVDKDRVESGYAPDGLNVNGDLKALLEQVARFDRYVRSPQNQSSVCMNLLFYGPPGTGKSELARHMAAELDRKLHVKRVSDLHSKWVGDTEKNIREAFFNAEAEQAVLVIDEADSLLFSRDRARNSWEISFTNEFLARMERFRGILICSTNRLKDLDEASLRRFVVKLRFDFLKPDGNLIFYRRLLAGLVSRPLPKSLIRRLHRISNLAPGDFSTVKKRFSFCPAGELDHNLLVTALEQEAGLKTTHSGKRVVGF